QRGYEEAYARAAQLKTGYEEQYRAYLDQQAGILARTLVQDMPCPVCGSKEHPSPGVLTGQAPTKEALDDLREQAGSAEAKAVKASEQAAIVKAKEEAKWEALALRIGELFSGDATAMSGVEAREGSQIASLLSQTKEEVLAQRQRLSQELSRVQRQVKRKEALEAQLPLMETKQKQEEGALREVTAQGLMYRTEIKGLRENLDKVASSLAYSSKAEAQTALSRLEAKLEELDEEREQAEQQRQRIGAEVSGLNGKIQTLSAQVNDGEQLDQEALREQLLAGKTAKAKQTAALAAVAMRLDQNQRALTGIQTQSKVLAQTEEQYAQVRALAGTASGNISGKEKIMLETYIQMTYFDRIIARANTRFMVMSGGQYELKRKTTAENNRSQSGLELDVLDHYNGTERSVKTLSGGEAFKASLSLALGLSDEIQHSAGGIKLDTMFVDEGFGSLDEESLAQAIDTLAGLAEGNRLIGIISHVRELKEKIDKQIIVTKEKSGGSHGELRV
ncbi:MAG: SbcC/MukB-like Walker B domain-containing protein, partial [Anaerovoracaceae bacterium]